MLYEDVRVKAGSLHGADTVRDTRYGGILTAVYGIFDDLRCYYKQDNTAGNT